MTRDNKQSTCDVAYPQTKDISKVFTLRSK